MNFIEIVTVVKINIDEESLLGFTNKNLLWKESANLFALTLIKGLLSIHFSVP